MERLAVVDTERFALGIALSAFDAVATWAWLTLGVATEANPVIQAMIESQGLVVAMGIRASLGLVWFGGFRVLATRSRLAGWGNLLATLLLGGIALYHLVFASRVLLG